MREINQIEILSVISGGACDPYFVLKGGSCGSAGRKNSTAIVTWYRDYYGYCKEATGTSQLFCQGVKMGEFRAGDMASCKPDDMIYIKCSDNYLCCGTVKFM